MEDKLLHSFGYALEELQRPSIQLSAFQKDAIKSIVLGEDTFAGLPTNHSESLVFKCFSHCLDFMTKDMVNQTLATILIISPLIELTRSQVKDLQARRQTAVRLAGDVTKDEDQLYREAISYAYSSPESVTETRWKTLMRTEEFVSNLEAFFDEAHCVESWGAGLEPFHRKYAELASLTPLLQSFELLSSSYSTLHSAEHSPYLFPRRHLRCQQAFSHSA